MSLRVWPSPGAGRVLGAWSASLALVCAWRPAAALEPEPSTASAARVIGPGSGTTPSRPDDGSTRRGRSAGSPASSGDTIGPAERAGTRTSSEGPTGSAGSVTPLEDAAALIDAGQPIEGARRLSDAYLAMPSERRVGDEGRRLVMQASQAFVRGGGPAPAPAVLESERVLLTAYFADLGEARAAGRPTAASDAQEQWLGQRLATVERGLAWGSPALGDDGLGAIDGAMDGATAGGIEAAAMKRERAVARLLLGAGATGTIGGGIMVIVGATAASRAERIRAGVPREDAEDARRAKAAGSLLATFGALVFSGSVMMLGVGGTRLRELREGSSLSLIPTRRGIALSGRF